MSSQTRHSNPLIAPRILGGQWRGRKLRVENHPQIRPTPSIQRERIFNWLAPIIQSRTMLDCFAGSGALAFEGLSRGALYARLLEKEPVAVQQLIAFATCVGSLSADILQVDSMRYLAQPADRSFNLIFLDPPFMAPWLSELPTLLETYQWLSKEAYIYMEQPKNSPSCSVPPNWQLYRQKTGGQIRCELYKRREPCLS